MEKMGKTLSPLRLKDIECTLGVLFKLLMVEVSKKQLFDNDKMVAINSKKGGVYSIYG